jgi:zinc protease
MYSFKHMLRHTFAGTLMLAAGFATATAQDLKAELPVDPHIIKGKFANGLTYYVRPNGKPEHKVELRLVVKAGSILENDDQQGLAHFMEHMNFNGTKNFQKNDLVSYLQSIGVQFGADLNAYTAFDQTVYILPIPTDKPGNLEKGFQIIEDWAHNALLTDKDIDDERGVVLEESRLNKGAQMRMLRKFFPKLASGTKYAERLPIGKDDILKTFKYDKIRSFYHDWYRPDLQAVAVVGDIDSATAMKMLKEHFEGLKNPKNERPREYVEVKPRTKSEAMVLTDNEATNSTLAIFFSYNKKHEEKVLGDYRQDIVRALTLQMINRRLKDLTKSSNPPFAYASVDFDDLIQGYEALEAQTMFDNDGPEKALNALAAELLRVKQYGFTKSELEVAKKNVMSGMEQVYNERKTTESSDYVEEYIRNFLDNEPIPGIENEYSYYKSMLPGIDLEEVNTAVKGWMSNMNEFTLITAPNKTGLNIPTEPQLLAMTSKAFAQEVKPMEEKAVASDLEVGDIKGGHIVSQVPVNGINATTYTLDNGIKVTIKQTDFKSDEILVKGIKKGGTNSYGVADKSNVNFATNIVDAMGVGQYTPNDLEKVMAGKTAKVDFDISDIDDDISGNCSVKDFETLMKLIYLNAMQPRKDEALFNAYKTKQKTMLQFMSANPQVSFFDTTIKSLYGGNPLARMIFPHMEDFDKLNLDRSLQIYKDEFSSADGYNFYIVGNVDMDKAIPAIEKYLGAIPAAHKEPEYKDNGVRMVKGDHTIKVKKGKEKQSMIFAGYYGDAKYSEDLALQAKAVADILNIKVIEDLREKMGGIYTGGFFADVRKEPYSRYAVMMQLPCGPENVDKLLDASKEEIKNLKEKGPDAADLDKVKSQWREKYRTNLKENKYWSQKMEDILFWGRNQDHVTQYEIWIDKLTPEDIQKTAKLLFDGKNEFTSILYPES